MPAPPARRDSANDLSKPQRQSPIAAVFLVLQAVRSIGILQIVFGIGFILSRSPSLPAVLIGATVLVLIALVISLLSWWRYTFSVQEGELRVENGVLSKNRLVIPLDRVQGVSIQQKFLHRLVGLVEVTADTAGAALAEFNLAAVKRPIAEALQAAAADQRAVATTAEPATLANGAVDAVAEAFTPPVAEESERVVVKRTPRDIVKLGLTTFPLAGLALLGPLVAVALEFEDRVDIPTPDVVVDPGIWLVWAVPLAVIAVVILGLTLNVAQSFLRLWDLTITRTASGLRRNAGLLSKSSTASSIPRIQIVRVRQSWSSRLVNMADVTLVGVNRLSAAAAGGAIGVGPISVPGCSEADVSALREIALDGALGVTSLERTVSSAIVFKETRNTTVVVILSIVGLWFIAAWWPLLLLILIPWRWGVVRRQARLRRWGISHDAVADRQQFIGWTSSETLLRKINSVTVHQSLFERKRDLATISFVLAGGVVSIGMIPFEQAKAARDRALYVAETDRRAFM